MGESARLRSGDPVAATSPWFDGARVSVVAARGEIIGLVVQHRGGGPVALRFPASGAALAVRGFAVEALAVPRPSTAMYGGSHGAGSYADGLVPADDPASDPAYFELEVARDAPPGAMAGALEVGGRSYPVELTIAPVTLPALPPRVWAYEDPREFAWAGADERACIAMFRRHGVLLSPDVHLEDWPARKELLSDIHDVPVWISDDPARAGDQVRGWLAALAGTGQVPFAIPIDEPHTPADRLRVRALADAVRAAGGGPTSFRFAVTDEPHDEYGDAVDLYITLRPHRDDGSRTRWTYNGAPPRAGALVLDAEWRGMRTWGWIAWRWQIPIWYVWDAAYWHDRHNRHGAPLPGRALDATRDAVSFDDGEDHGNLDGVLAYPDAQASLRLVEIRRGVTDRALLDALARCAGRPAADAIARSIMPTALAAAGLPPAPGAWPVDEQTWEAARGRVLDALVACAAPR